MDYKGITKNSLFIDYEQLTTIYEDKLACIAQTQRDISAPGNNPRAKTDKPFTLNSKLKSKLCFAGNWSAVS